MWAWRRYKTGSDTRFIIFTVTDLETVKGSANAVQSELRLSRMKPYGEVSWQMVSKNRGWTHFVAPQKHANLQKKNLLPVIKWQRTGTAVSVAPPGVRGKTPSLLRARMFTRLRAERYETTNGIQVCARSACAAPLVKQVLTQQTRPTSVKTAAAVHQETSAAGGPLKSPEFCSQTGADWFQHWVHWCLSHATGMRGLSAERINWLTLTFHVFLPHF